MQKNAEGSFIGDAEHCKNFQSSNKIMLYNTKSDTPAMNRPAMTFIHFYIDYDFYIFYIFLYMYIYFIDLFTCYFKFCLAHRLHYAP